MPQNLTMVPFQCSPPAANGQCSWKTAHKVVELTSLGGCLLVDVKLRWPLKTSWCSHKLQLEVFRTLFDRIS